MPIFLFSLLHKYNWLDLRKYINNISGLQIFQLLRFGAFLLISIIFTKSPVSTDDIGLYEISLFIASAVSFFWLTGLIQSFLPLCNNNKTFKRAQKGEDRKSPEMFNAFLLICAFSLLMVFVGYSLKSSIYVFSNVSEVPFYNLVLIYILISNPAHMVEYIYVLKNKSSELVLYGIITYTVQVIIVAVPVILGYPIELALWGLIIISGLRFIWLIILLRRYAAFTISYSFIKEHIYLGFPLIVSTLLSGSGQYIDGMIVSNKFDAATFAIFRYGAKELPLATILAGAMSNAMLTEFADRKNIGTALNKIKTKSKRLMNFLFPITILLVFSCNWIYPRVFNANFVRSADVFMVYLLLVISRIVFPQTILIGLKQTKVVMVSSLVEIVINILLSLYLIKFYGIVGVAVATVVVYALEKIILVAYNYFKFKIKPGDYIPLKLYFLYTFILLLIFVLIDHGIIKPY